VYKRRSLNICRISALASLVAAASFFFTPVIAVAADFVGSDQCQGCHEVNYRDWSASGHPYKLMKSEEARHRPIPLPLGVTWADVSYVIGGYYWKSRYIDDRGYIITVTEDEDGNPIDGGNQYNYLTGEWVDYHAGEVDKPYNCGSCHTTNWVADTDAMTDNDLSDNQDGLPGMWGTFDAGGIHCEQCHGNGIGFPGSGSMEVDDSAESCGECHYREAPPGTEVNVIPASKGFVKHHEQYNEHLASPHAEMKCVDCHNPHKRGEFSIWADGDINQTPSAGLPGTGAQCGVDCHSDKMDTYAAHAMADYAVECKDCHMPYATKSANQLGEFEGDVKTHLFYIATDADYEMFTPDKAYVALDAEGKGKADLNFACKRCHATTDLDELAKFARNFHDPDLSEIGFNPGLTGTWWGGPTHDGEGFLVEFAYSNGVLVMVVSFYTYDSLGNQVWLTAAGPVSGNMATLDLYITDGAMWGADFDPNAVNRVLWGTAKFTMPTCTTGNVQLTPNAAMMAEGFTAHAYPLSRDLTEHKIQCPTFVNNPD